MLEPILNTFHESPSMQYLPIQYNLLTVGKTGPQARFVLEAGCLLDMAKEDPRTLGGCVITREYEVLCSHLDYNLTFLIMQSTKSFLSSVDAKDLKSIEFDYQHVYLPNDENTKPTYLLKVQLSRIYLCLLVRLEKDEQLEYYKKMVSLVESRSQLTTRCQI